MSQAGQEVVFLCLISISFVIGRWFVTLPERTGSCIPLPATCGNVLGLLGSVQFSALVFPVVFRP